MLKAPKISGFSSIPASGLYQTSNSKKLIGNYESRKKLWSCTIQPSAHNLKGKEKFAEAKLISAGSTDQFLEVWGECGVSKPGS